MLPWLHFSAKPCCQGARGKDAFEEAAAARGLGSSFVLALVACVFLEHKALRRNPLQLDFHGRTKHPAVPRGMLGPCCCCRRCTPGRCGSHGTTQHHPWGSAAQISTGKNNHPPETSQQPAGMAGIPWDDRFCWACRHLPSRRAKKQLAKSQQNHESKTTEPQSASESLPRPPPRPHSPPKLAATCSRPPSR